MTQSAPDPIYILRGSKPITALHFLTTDRETLLGTGNSQGDLQIWDMETKRIRDCITHQSGQAVLWIDQDLDTGHVISQSRGGKVHWWSLTGGTWTRLGSIKSASMGFCGCCLLGSGSKGLISVPSPDSQSQIDVLDLKNHHKIASLKPEPPCKYGMCMSIKSAGQCSENTGKIIIGYEDGSIALWDIRVQKVVHQYKVHKDLVMCLDYSEARRLGVSGSANNTLLTWKLDDGTITPGKEIIITNPGINDVVIRNDQKILTTAGWDGQVRVFDVKKRSPLAVLSHHSESVQCLTFSPHNLLACGSRDGQVSLWDIYRILYLLSKWVNRITFNITAHLISGFQ